MNVRAILVAGKPRRCRRLGKDDIRKAGDVYSDGRLVMVGLGRCVGVWAGETGIYRPIVPSPKGATPRRVAKKKLVRAGRR
jgi:hypothetical protein